VPAQAGVGLSGRGATLHPYTLSPKPCHLRRPPQLHAVPFRIGEPAEAAVVVSLLFRIDLSSGGIFGRRREQVRSRFVRARPSASLS
jgi:hypothetical protein